MLLVPLRALGRVLAPALLLLALAASATGCLRFPFYAEPVTLAGVVQVRTFDAYARGDRVFVKTFITNTSPQPIVVDRDGFALKLPGGVVVPRASGTTTQHKPYMLAPGEGRDVYVDFVAPMDVEGLPTVVLVVGGISVGGDPRPRVVGEIPLQQVPAGPTPPTTPPAP